MAAINAHNSSDKGLDGEDALETRKRRSTGISSDNDENRQQNESDQEHSGGEEDIDDNMSGGPEDHGMIDGHRVRNNRELDALGQKYGAGCKRLSTKRLRQHIRQETDGYLAPVLDEGGPGARRSLE